MMVDLSVFAKSLSDFFTGLDPNSIMAVIAFSSVISPILTAIVNNIFQARMKKMENQEQRYKENVLYKKNVVENYMSSLSALISSKSIDHLSDYGKYYALAYYYLPENIRELMSDIDKDLDNRELSQLSEKRDILIDKISLFLQNLT